MWGEIIWIKSSLEENQILYEEENDRFREILDKESITAKFVQAMDDIVAVRLFFSNGTNIINVLWSILNKL